MLMRLFFINLPLAAIATSVAYVLVALLIDVTDVLSAIVAHNAKGDITKFFDSAIQGLASTGAEIGEASEKSTGSNALGPNEVGSAVAAPLFVGFIAAILAAFAAFFVWIELLMRDAAIYAVSLFMPFGIAAAIWHRWAGALKRTGELIVVLVLSKFVIVAIIALSASLLAHGEGVEPVFAAGALLLIACFSPMLLMRFAAFAEGVVSASHTRHSSAGGAMQAASNLGSMTMMYRAAQQSWGSRDGGGGVKVLTRVRDSGGSGAPTPSAGKGGAGKAGAAGKSGTAAAGTTAAGAPGPVGVAAAVPRAAVGAEKAAAQKLASTAAAQGGEGSGAESQSGSGAAPSRPAAQGGSKGSGAPKPPDAAQPRISDRFAPGGGQATPVPRPPQGGSDAEKPNPRPPADVKSTDGKGGERK
jgi:hypothetical protein